MSNTLPVVKDRKITIALVGCGRISKNHFESIKNNEAYQLVAVCDNDENLAQTAGDTYGGKIYFDFEKMLKAEKPDLVSICTPSGTHPILTEIAASHGVNVITEKPMATDWQAGVRMVSACDEANVRLFVVKQNRRNQTLQLLKSAIDAGRFGKIYHVGINVYWTRPQEYYDQASWRGTWAMDGGAFMNQASHYVDLLHWLIGPVKRVHAMTGTLARDIEAEDTGVVNLEWENGALGAMNVCMLTYPKNFEGSITILGEKGTVRVGGVAVNEIKHWQFEDESNEDDKIQKASYETTSVYGFGHPLYYQNVVEVMRGEIEPETDGHEGLKSLELLSAIYTSSHQNKTVMLPLPR